MFQNKVISNKHVTMPTMPTMLVSHTNDTNHLFSCSQLPTKYNTTSLWKKPLEAAEVIQEWVFSLASLRD